MTNADETALDRAEEKTAAAICPRCNGFVPPRSPHVRIAGSAVQVYCSAECMQLGDAPLSVEPPRRRRSWARGTLHVGLGLASVLHLSGASEHASAPLAALPKSAVPTPMQPAAPPEPPMFGPAWPPTEDDWMAEIANDAWLHPLDGPKRQMPIHDGRVFGAERPGERPPECRSGHCGVDIGERWGAPVYASHDGNVERVQRGPNEEHGGLYVRLSHRNGTVFTQYFHLAAIPRWIQPGRFVKAGALIGLLGDSGIKESAPHLHFTLSVKPSRELPERFIDPESLIAIWPLRVPLGDGIEGMVSTTAAPGLPHAVLSHHMRASRSKTHEEATAEPALGGASE